MKSTVFTALAAFFAQSSASVIPSIRSPITPTLLHARQNSTNSTTSCTNTATSRNCWGDYSIDTNWYDVTPNTGVTREYWLSVENSTVNLDGYERHALTFNGTVPGPAIVADWGDNLIIHVTNNLEHNGTSIHWHGIRQLGSLEYDGVPGVTQCPIAPGDSLTYKFQATQYGTTWYHSHFTLQYGDGLLGPLVIHGPATANYDVDVGTIFLQDWAHESVFQRWDTARLGAPPSLQSNLINGTNVFNCTGSTDANCVGGGKKFELEFVSGTKYLLRLINVAVDGHFEFAIDGHKLTVVATDLVPIVPYETDTLLISIGQRYDVIVEANQPSGDYWLRGNWGTACSTNDNAANMTGIVRYDSSSTADPTSTPSTVRGTCADEPVASLVPHLKLDVGNYSIVEEGLSFAFTNYFTWTINGSSLLLDWANPTTLKIFNNETVFPTPYNVVALEPDAANDDWVVYVIEDNTGFGLNHPIHLHGHDFWVIAQEQDVFDPVTSPSKFNLVNAPRRDVASLPGNGYLAIAFKLDNPGSWLLHCHIAWHASEGLAMQFVETQSQIAIGMSDTNTFEQTCSNWNKYVPNEEFAEDDSGI
ncbi:putative Laccase-2 protein [Rutstroemia sp. NJR-2017a BVV2]|nr:putative Laccase-2 protein [Rutstroemia sp. NJR-2017a BVV2]